MTHTKEKEKKTIRYFVHVAMKNHAKFGFPTLKKHGAKMIFRVKKKNPFDV